MKNRIALGIGLLLMSCARTGAPPPTAKPELKPIEEIIQEDTDPRRAASLRLVEQGRKSLATSAFDRAAHQFSSAIEIDSKNPYAYFYLGLARMKGARFAEAAELFKRAADLFKELPDWRAESLAYRGENLTKLRRWTEARAAYQAALDIESSNSRAQEGLATLEK